jgi:beta-fructofuranosidase
MNAYQHKTYVYDSHDLLNFEAYKEKEITSLRSHATEIFQDEDSHWYFSSVEYSYRGISLDKTKREE